MRNKVVLAAVLAITGASLLVTSAMAGVDANRATRGGTLHTNLATSDFEYIDPQKCYDTGCNETLWPTMYNLMQYPEKNGPEGKRVYAEAAAGLPVVSKDGKTYTFTVRTGHKASNGKTVTPQWFVRAFERLLSPKMGDAASARFGGISNFADIVGAQEFYDGKAAKISGIQVSGNKLIFKLKKPFPALVSALAMNWFTATDPATPYSEQDMKTVVGAGPYYISSREVGRNVVLDRNKNYKGTRPANPDKMIVSVNVDENQGLLQVKAGQADYIGPTGVPAASAAELGEQFGINKGRFFVLPTSVTSYWALASLPGAPFNNVKLRQAVNWAIDRPAQVRISGKYGGRRTDQILPPSMPGFIENNSLYAYKAANPTKAKADRRRRFERAYDPHPGPQLGVEHQPQSDHAVQPRADGPQGEDRVGPDLSAVLPLGRQEDWELRHDRHRLAGGLPRSAQLHQRAPRRSPDPGLGLEQQRCVLQQRQVQRCDGQG